MKKGTDLDATHDALGGVAAFTQELNRGAFILMMFIRSGATPVILLCVTLAFSTYAASFGYANVMYNSHLMSASSELAKPITDSIVIAAAWQAAWIEGYALMGVCSACIIAFVVLPVKGTEFENVSKIAAGIEVVLGVGGFILDSYSRLGITNMFFMQVFVQCLFRAAAPVLSHWIASWLRNEYGERIDRAYDIFMAKIDEDYNSIT